MKKGMLILLLSLLFPGFDFQPASSQVGNQYVDFISLVIDSKKSLNGLETSDYRKISLKVQLQGKNEHLLGLTEEQIRSQCELRLKQAGMEIVPERRSGEFFLVSINALSTSFLLSAEFRRPVVFAAEKTIHTINTETWKRTVFGSHGGRQDFVMSGVDGLVDSFTKDYLEANSKGKVPPPAR